MLFKNAGIAFGWRQNWNILKTWLVTAVVTNFSSVVWTENIWCIFRVKPPVSNYFLLRSVDPASVLYCFVKYIKKVLPGPQIYKRHKTYQTRLCHSPDAIYPHNHVTTRTPHASIFNAGLAAHETRLMRHVGSTAVFMKTPCSRKIQIITFFNTVTLLC